MCIRLVLIAGLAFGICTASAEAQTRCVGTLSVKSGVVDNVYVHYNPPICLSGAGMPQAVKDEAIAQSNGSSTKKFFFGEWDYVGGPNEVVIPIGTCGGTKCLISLADVYGER